MVLGYFLRTHLEARIVATSTFLILMYVLRYQRMITLESSKAYHKNQNIRTYIYRERQRHGAKNLNEGPGNGNGLRLMRLLG